MTGHRDRTRRRTETRPAPSGLFEGRETSAGQSAGDARSDGANEAQRREHYTERLRQYLQDPEFRRTEGFPLGEDKDILALSDPPYYTACPNPFLPEILEQWRQERTDQRRDLGLPDDTHDNGDSGSAMPDGTPSAGEGHYQYRREPFAADVSEGKNHPIYNAHSYHTKVPHKAIMRYILHYTEPGDIVFDGFCGTGMTGVAAQLCGDKAAVEELGYYVDSNGLVFDGETAAAGTEGATEPLARLGPRKAVLVDLCPAATFIARNYNATLGATVFEQEAQRILQDAEEDCGWMYRTWHPHCDHPNRVMGRINYTVWSDIFRCPECGREMVYWEVAVDQQAGQVREEWPCPGCGALLAKSPSKRSGALKVERAWQTVYDRALGDTVRQAKQVPVLVNYTSGGGRHEKAPDAEDLALIGRIGESDIPYWFPSDRMRAGDESRRNDDIGATHVHHFHTRRNLWVLAALWARATHPALQWLVSSCVQRASKQHQIAISRVGGPKENAGGKTAGHRRGTLYIPSNQVEFSPFALTRTRLKTMAIALRSELAVQGTTTMTCSSTVIDAAPDTIDYIFVDPPFGSDIMYAELNYVWESWLRVFTANRFEAVVSKTQGKRLPEYQRVMERCFREFYRILKPGRWMTVEFHNSQNRVWNAIQEAMLRAGFVVADVRGLDKVKKTHTQVTSAGAVEQDLIISAYKPRTGFERRFLQEAGTPQGAWYFVRQHLEQLPVVVETNAILKRVAERQPYLLFDRMVAFHIQRGATVPLSAAEFYAGMRERLVERDGMFFLPDQVPEYDRARLLAKQMGQLSYLVSDEKSTIQWLRQQLDSGAGGQPQTYAPVPPAAASGPPRGFA